MPQNPKTREALEGSIKKWEGVVAGTLKDQGSANCPLCGLFNRKDTPPNLECFGCPVRDRSKRRNCIGTAYIEYISDPSQENALKELEFLKSLREPA